MTKSETKTKGMCIATRCTSVEQFIQMFHRFVDEDSFFVSTLNTREPGLETSFSVQLVDGTPVLRGVCVVLQSWSQPNSPFKTPGVRLGIKRLTANSMAVFERLLVTRSAGPPPPPPPPQAALAAGTVTPKTAFSETAPTKLAPSRVELAAPAVPVTGEPTVRERPASQPAETNEERTPGSDLVLPANPLMNLTDESLEGYVDCTLYEETGNFFPVDEDPEYPLDDVAPPPPLLAPRPVIARASTPAPVPMSIEIEAEPPPERPVPHATATAGETSAESPSFDDLVAPGRDSTPTFGESAPLLAARTKRSRWWLIAGFGAVAAATAALVIVKQNRLESQASPAAAPATEHVAETAPVEQPRPTEPPTTEPPVVDPAPPTDEPPPTDGPPVVGKGPCKLAIASTPAGSMVQLDGERLAPSPVTIATTCGKHKVDISHPRYQTATKLVTLDAAAPGKVDVTLTRPTHAVSITSTPSGATIFIDGRRAGTTPTVVNVLGFMTMKLEFKKTGYQPLEAKHYSKVSQDKLSVKLKKW